MKKLLIGLVFLLGIVPTAWAQADSVQVRLETDKGDILLSLDRARAPKTVSNFLAYVNSGFYNGTIFHRVIKGFMIQGGGFTAEMKEKATRAPIQNEADNGLSNRRGTIAMARTSDPQSATAQFFINTKDNLFLDHTADTWQGWGYCVFGKVIGGMDVVTAIEGVKTGTRGGYKDVPVVPVRILKATVIKTKSIPSGSHPQKP
jgi:peptidyl-prolyl cis-trans isomerase B (cyclophilin B)